MLYEVTRFLFRGLWSPHEQDSHALTGDDHELDPHFLLFPQQLLVDPAAETSIRANLDILSSHLCQGVLISEGKELDQVDVAPCVILGSSNGSVGSIMTAYGCSTVGPTDLLTDDDFVRCIHASIC